MDPDERIYGEPDELPSGNVGFTYERESEPQEAARGYMKYDAIRVN